MDHNHAEMDHSHAVIDQSTAFFDQSLFMPHGHCYLWQPALVWTHVISDFLIGFAYLTISLILYGLVRKIRLPFSPVFIAFGVFIGACGLTHFIEIWNLWHADYWMAGMVKAITAVASVITASALFPIKPKVIALADSARLSEERKVKLESAHAELGTLYEKIKESDRLKTQFFSNVSHELRTPLSLILGPVEEIMASGDLTEKQRKNLEVVARNSKTLLKHVNDLLDISKLEAGRLKPRYVKTDVVKLFRFVAAHFETIMQSKSIFFSVQTPDSIIADVDPDKLQRVYMNLLSNAVKFSPAGGRIRITMKEEGPEFTFRIEDTGPGVEASLREVIFERFRQGEGGVNRKVGGTGLGLAIVKDFVEMHQGHVVLLDHYSPGATFMITLPLHAPSNGEYSHEDNDDIPDSATLVIEGAVAELNTLLAGEPEMLMRPGLATVLVCEDNPDMSLFVLETLVNDFNVIRAVDGADGLLKARVFKPDLIVSDIMMPNVSGDQLVRELKKEESLRDIPILLLSARADDDMRVALLKDGASDYLVKPFAPEELRARAWNLMSIKKVRDVLNQELVTKSEDVVGLARELGVRKREAELATEAMKNALAEAEKASQAKGAFLGLISHELNTPLSSMNLVIQLLQKKERDKMEPRQQEMLDRLSSSSQQMKDLVEGLLEYVRSGGDSQGKEVLCDLKKVAQEAASSFEPLAHQKGLVLQTSWTEEECLTMADPMKIRMILNNLLMNALKFTEKGSVVLTLRCEENRRLLIVRDTGPGIPVGDQARIFDPFERIEPLERKTIPGIGLGLALVRQIVKSLDGNIRVESDGKNGSALIVELKAPETRP